MNSENSSLVDQLFIAWGKLSPAGKMLAGGTAAIWLIWLLWLPIAQDLQATDQQTFLPTVSDTNTSSAIDIENKNENGQDEEVYLPAITDEKQDD